MIQAHPLKLKRALDPSQSPADRKGKHVVARLRADVKRVQQKIYPCKYIFHSVCPHIVPYDRCFQLFLFILRENYQALISALTSNIDNCLSEKDLTDKLSPLYVISSSQNEIIAWQSCPVLQDVYSAIMGIEKFYPRDQEEDPSDRIYVSPQQSDDLLNPIEAVAKTCLFDEWYHSPYSGLIDEGPYHENELLWLQSFCVSIDWIEKAFPELTLKVYEQADRSYTAQLDTESLNETVAALKINA